MILVYVDVTRLGNSIAGLLCTVWQIPLDEQLIIRGITAQYEPARTRKKMILISARRKLTFMNLTSQITLISIHVDRRTNQSPANSQGFSVYSCVGVFVLEGQCRPLDDLVFFLFVTVHHPVTINQLVFISQSVLVHLQQLASVLFFRV